MHESGEASRRGSQWKLGSQRKTRVADAWLETYRLKWSPENGGGVQECSRKRDHHVQKPEARMPATLTHRWSDSRVDGAEGTRQKDGPKL